MFMAERVRAGWLSIFSTSIDVMLARGASAFRRSASPLAKFALLIAPIIAISALLSTDRPVDKPVTGRAVPYHAATIRKPTAVQKAANRRPVAAPSAFAEELAMSNAALIDRWNPLIKTASRRFGVPEIWIRAVLMIESGGRTMLGEHTPITSSAGAMGLMQVMPKTWLEMRRQYGLGNDPYNPHDNIFAGTAYLESLYRQYSYPGLFAAYNDGPDMLEAHRRLRQFLPAETTTYVLDVASILSTGLRRARVPAGDAARVEPLGTPVTIDTGTVVSVPATRPHQSADGDGDAENDDER